MKKLRSLLIALMLGAALAACGPGNNPNVDSPAAGDETPVAPASGDVDTPGTDGVNEGDNDVIGDAEDDGLDPLATPTNP